MTQKKYAEPQFKLGEYVKIPYSGFKRGRIVELRGPLAPGGVQVYRILLRRKPRPYYTELREDQIEHLPADEQPAAATQRVFQLGDYVRIRHSPYRWAQVVELRGPVGPNGAPLYGVRIRGGKLDGVYMELRGDQLKLLPREKWPAGNAERPEQT
jgi:hypothetical protein